MKGKNLDMEEQLRFLLELRGYLISHWKRFGISGSPTGLAYRIRQATRGRTIDKSRLVALWFIDNPEQIQVVTKWIGNPEFSSLTLEEHRHSQWLYDAKDLRITPKPLDCVEILGIPVFIEEAITGRSFAHQIMSLGSTALEAIFNKALPILSKIQDPLQPASKEVLLEELQRSLVRAEKVLGWSSERASRIRETLKNAIPDPIPGTGKTLLVGDFAPRNLLEGNKGIFLIDLEFAHESCMAFLDPISYVHSVFSFTSQAYSRKNRDDATLAFKETLLEGKHLLGKLARNFLTARGVLEECLSWYWLVFFIHETAFEHSLMEELPGEHLKLYDKHISDLAERLQGLKIH